MIRGKYFHEGLFRKFQWIEGLPFPQHVTFEELMESSAWHIIIGPRLKPILSEYFSNIPSTMSPEVVYTGELAKFIVTNLFVLLKEGILDVKVD
jgi:hypothetical protein